MFTLGFVFLFTYHDGAREFAVQNIWLLLTAVIVGCATILAISCCESVRHTSPHNFIVLAIFTVAEGYVVGMSTLHAQPEVVNLLCTSLNWMSCFWCNFFFFSYKLRQVLQAVGLTAIVVIGLTIFAIQTKWDFTMMGGMLFVFLILLVVITFILGFTSFGRSNTGSLILSGFGALLFAVYLICEYHLLSRYSSTTF